MLESPLDRRVDRVQPVQRQRLGRRKPASGRGRRPVVAENAVQQRQPAMLIESPHAVLGQQLLTEHQMTEQPPLLGQADLGAVRELPRPAEVVRDRGGQQQIGVQPRVQLAGLVRERRDRDRVLEQPAEVGVVPRPACTAPGATRLAARRRPAGRPATPGSRGRRPRPKGARESRRARPGRGMQTVGSAAGSTASESAREISDSSSTSSSRNRSTRPTTRTTSPRSNRPASASAFWNARAGTAPVRSRSSSARYAEPVRVISRSLRVHANTPLTSCPGRSAVTAARV